MIDVIKLVSNEYAGGRKVDQAQIWIGGIPFQCDVTQHTIRVVNRISREIGIELQDIRRVDFAEQKHKGTA